MPARGGRGRQEATVRLERRSTAVLVAVAALMAMANMHAISQEVARQGERGEGRVQGSRGSSDHVQGATKICCGFVKRAATQKPIDQATSR